MRPDLDAVGAVWAIKRFLPNWEDAEVRFVPAGERLAAKGKGQRVKSTKVIEKIGEDEVAHVDTGLGPLDHHQTDSEDTCAAKRAWEWVVKNQKSEREAGDRLMTMICEIDHFKEVFWPDPASDRYEITVSRILDGLKLLEKEDKEIMEFGLLCMNSLYRAFQNKVWAEKELREKGIEFKTRFGNGIGVQTYNDDVIHLSQRMGYQVALRKDPRKAYVRIKATPPVKGQRDIDLTPAYEKLKRMDPQATWFLHVSKRMLLNGTAKNPKMKPTKLSLQEIIEVLEKI